MKRIISFALICVLVLSSLLLTACDLDSSDDLIDSGATDTETVTDTETETEVPAEPVPVDSLGGKNPKQLFLQFYDEYAQSQGYDITMTARTTEDGVTSNITMTVKLNNESAYVYMKNGDEEIKVWYVDGVSYAEMDGEKYKTSNSDIDDMFGDGFIDAVVEMLPDKADIPQTYLKKLEEAQLYFYEGFYYCTVTVSDSEAEAMGEEKGYKETIYFDANGKVKKIVDEAVDMYVSAVLTTYGKTVVINAPADAHKFVDADNGGNSSGDNDPQIYAKYTQVCDALDAIDVYGMDIAIDDQLYMEYATDGQNEYLGVYEDDILYSVWKIGEKGYAGVDNQTPSEEQLDDDVQQSFYNAALVKDIVADKKSNSSISDLMFETSQGENIISFAIYSGLDYTDYYTYTYDDEFSFVQLTVESIDGQEIESISYYFSIIDDPNFQITKPI